MPTQVMKITERQGSLIRSLIRSELHDLESCELVSMYLRISLLVTNICPRDIGISNERFSIGGSFQMDFKLFSVTYGHRIR